ncbi:MAG: hypothetical protein CSB16_01480 [Clostridiales bacterium]|nr:MAG: hypothetical protein CSB16_01480 [Clostridiales bacterium]
MQSFFNSIISNQILLKWVIKIVSVIAVIVIGFKLAEFIAKLIKKRVLKSSSNMTLASFSYTFMNFMFKFGIICFAVLLIDVPAATVSAILGTVFLSIGFALQGSLSNLAGGIIIVVFKPFELGDFIELDSEKKGVVEEIGILATSIITLDNRVVVVPNSVITSNSLINVFKKNKRKVIGKFDVAYSSDTELVKRVLSEIALSVGALEEAEVYISSYKDSSIEFEMRFWIESTNYWDAYWGMNEQVKSQFEKNSIDIPFPQLDVKLKQ